MSAFISKVCIKNYKMYSFGILRAGGNHNIAHTTVSCLPGVSTASEPVIAVPQ